MLSKNEYIFMLKSLFLTFVVVLLVKYMNILQLNFGENFFLSLQLTILLKTMYDIKYKTGYKKAYKYGYRVNQYLRYLSFFMALIFNLFLIFILVR